jgi:hypothetical protein
MKFLVAHGVSFSVDRKKYTASGRGSRGGHERGR